jgi:hypothetical protein
VACAYISLPEDEVDAGYKMMDNQSVRLSHTKPIPEARAVRSWVLWKVRQLAAKHSGVVRWDQDVPERDTLLPPG